LWAGVDSIQEQKNIEARKLLEKRAESHKSAARFVGWRFVVQGLLIENKMPNPTCLRLPVSLLLAMSKKIMIYQNAK
jgi:hypothetical protein